MMLILRGLMLMLLMASGVALGNEVCKLPKVLHFATIPKKSLTQQYEEFEPLRQELQRVLGVPVRTVSVHSYQAVIEGLLSGAVDIAELGPAAYIRAKERDPGIKAVAAYSFKGGPFTPQGSYYNSLLLVKKGARIESIHDLQGRSVALTDPGSTSGALIPMTEFKRETGVVLAEYVGRQVYAGSHDRAIEAVLSGAVDAAFVSSRRADDYIGRGKSTAGALQELWRSRPIHYDPFTLNSRLCPETRALIRQVMLTPSPARQLLLKTKGAVGMQAVSDEDYRWLEPLIRQQP